MASSSRTLEITVLSCEDLRIDGKSVKKNTYVVVRTDHLNYRTTKIDTEGGSYPSWNQNLLIDMPLHERFVTLEVNCKMASSDRIIGTARIPVTDFMGGYLPDNYLNFLSYRLRDSRGVRNGIVNISVKVKLPEYLSSKNNKKVTENSACSTASKPPLKMPIGGEKNFGVVAGIPVWNINYL
ncbi:hypothetical protein JCGZ_14448 [Jatropha curcas]|uniref:C2 domain-containing protein n=1 Tax=Jatropha curcas TaxID=180498 RepID=A0A067JXR5_JATCU|nr:BON1-associated protein 2 [Jatropha curcas]KDP28677.1 hypothetical protein JCGZ_14448 [Jatropha curcas]